MSDWESGFKTVDQPGGNRRPHLRTNGRHADADPVSHANPPTPFPTSNEKSVEQRHRCRPDSQADLLRHSPEGSSQSSPSHGARFKGRAEVMELQASRPHRAGGRKPGTPDHYVSHEPGAKGSLDGAQRFQSRPNDFNGLLQADERLIKPHNQQAGQRFQSTREKEPPIGGGGEDMSLDPGSPNLYASSQRCSCRPADGGLAVNRSSDAEQLRFYNSTQGQPSPLIC